MRPTEAAPPRIVAPADAPRKSLRGDVTLEVALIDAGNWDLGIGETRMERLEGGEVRSLRG